MDITLFIDTNILFTKNFTDFKKLKFIDNLKRLIKDISVNNFPCNLSIVIPRITIDELIQQQVESYDEKIRDLRKYNFPNFEVIEIENYSEYLGEKLLNEFEYINTPQVKSLIYDYPRNFEFDNIIRRAIKKLPPFEGKEKESDKGFKDVILWEMLIEYQKNNPKSKVILCTDDKKFKSEILTDESTRRVQSVFDIVNWHIGNSEIIELLGETLNKSTKLSLESKIIRDFNDLIFQSNIRDLFNELKFKNPIYNNDYVLKDLKIIEFNLLTDITPHEHLGITGFYYFMVEIKIKFDFVDEIFMKSDFGDIISKSDFYEYEILYNSKKNEYLIISYDSIDSIEYINDGFKLMKAEKNRS